MILVTVGTQFPFDRLVSIIDNHAESSPMAIHAQIGETDYQAKNIKADKFMEPDELDALMDESKVVISHAGMGTIIKCINLRKPVILFPRLSKLGEHRNDHQLDTINSFAELVGVYPAFDEKELVELIKKADTLTPPSGFKNADRTRLVDFLKSQMV